MRRIGRWSSVPALMFGIGMLAAAGAADDEGGGRLKLVESVPRDDLDSVITPAISADGKFLYAASWRPATVTVFRRDAGAGTLAHVQTITDPEGLGGTTAVSLSRDGRLAIASAFQSRTAVLFSRDAETGALTRLDVARDGEKGVRLGFPIDAAFSPDGKFVYVLDDSGPREGGRGSVAVFRVADHALALVGIDEGRDGCYAGARGLAFHPDGKTLFVACNTAGTLVVADRDPATGATNVRQVIKDEEGDVHGLAGAMGVAIGPDGRDVYVSSGRFGGDDAVTAFRLGSDGRLGVVQEFANGNEKLRDFRGGNGIIVSPDGLSVVACGTRSRSIATFRRDPATGSLTYLATLPDGGDGGEFGAADLTYSPDSRFLYVGTEDGKSVSVFRRDP